MSVVLRLARAGRKKLPFYHIVASDKRSKRDGGYIEKIGTYNPLVEENALNWNKERVEHWLSVGAQASDRVAKFIIAEGVGSEKVRTKMKGKLDYSMRKVQERLAKEKAAKEAEEAAARAEEEAANAPAEEAPAEAAPAEEAAAPAEENPAEEAPAEAPAEEEKKAE